MDGLEEAPNVERLALEVTCEAFGHHASEESFAEYPDGLVAARCVRCHKRMTMDGVPGGVSYLRIKRLVAAILDGQTTSYNLIAFRELEDRVIAEREKLNEIESLLILAQEMINAQ